MKLMNGDSIGAYAFVTSDYKDLDFPLDLWIDWHAGMLDQIALVTYGKFDLPVRDNLKLIPIDEEVSNADFNFYLIGKTLAQKSLDTQWKVMLDIDEFLKVKPDVKNLDKTKAYALRYRNLFGNVNTEIINREFPRYQFRVHNGARTVLGDGGNISGPYDKRKSIGVFFNSSAERILGRRNWITWTEPNKTFEVFHTGSDRDPKSLKEKWITQLIRERNEKREFDQRRYNFLSRSDRFDFEAYRLIWPGSKISSVSDAELPEILLKNKPRFHWHTFES